MSARYPLMKQIFGDIIRGLLDGVYPRVCEVCGTTLTRGERHICLECDLTMMRTNIHLSRENRVNERLSRIAHLGICASWFYYDTDGGCSILIRRAKYGDRPRLARDLGAMFAREIIDTGVFDGVDVLVPVPQHVSRRIKRGYNQAEQIARGVSSVTSIPMDTHVVKAISRHRSQTHKSARERAANVSGTFAADDIGRVAGRNVMIVDDIFTTGATVEQVIMALGPGVGRIQVLTLGLTKLK